MIAKKHLLIVDDDASLRTLFQILVETYGYTSDLAEDGEVAITKLTQTHYDAVLLDYMMPGMNGMTVLGHIQQCYSMPVVMITGQTDDLMAAEAIEAGAKACLYKPFDCVDFHAILTEVFSENKFSGAGDVRIDVAVS